MTEVRCHRRVVRVAFRWPEPPLRVVLVHPEIPPNTGAIARLCAATGTPLHLVEPLGFRLTDRALRRAGLDYWDAVELYRHRTADEWLAAAPARFHLFSTAGARSYFEAEFLPGDALVFGSESVGLPEEWLQRWPDRVLAIPLRPDRVRSLNLATAVAAALYEALRQCAAR
ncbi:MAG: tRNA (cytidine(34)-2'-O)-methyltransferase [Kiritimatiellae bacterium]|nr:tRNA (cytidine(34)-2'-O)-methyltransferase [Kiritimatiellia bacterium]